MPTDTPQRYDMVTNYRCGQSVEELERADNGEWVRWEDVETALAHAEAEIASLRNLIVEGKAEDDRLLATEPPNCPCRYCLHICHRLEVWNMLLLASPSPVPKEK